jgi:hypothetical protein
LGAESLRAWKIHFGIVLIVLFAVAGMVLSLVLAVQLLAL